MGTGELWPLGTGHVRPRTLGRQQCGLDRHYFSIVDSPQSGAARDDDEWLLLVAVSVWRPELRQGLL